MVNNIFGDLKRIASLLEAIAQHTIGGVDLKSVQSYAQILSDVIWFTVVKPASYVTNKTNTIPCTRLGHLCHARYVGFDHQVHRQLQF